MTLSRDARARAVQLPAWNEALGLPRPWDQQWSLRIQQVLAFESDLLEYDDLFAGSRVVEAKVAELRRGGPGRDRTGAADGWRGRRGRVRVHEVRAGRRRTPRAAAGSSRASEVVVGVNRFTTTEPSPLTADLGAAIQAVDPGVEAAAVGPCARWRAERDADRPVRRAARPWRSCAAEAQTGANLDAGDAAVRPRRADDRGVGRRAARGVR